MFLVNFCNFLFLNWMLPRALHLRMEPTPVYALLRRSRSMARHTSRVYPSKQQALGAFGREISCFSKTTAKKLGTNTLLVPNLKVGVPVSPGPYGCCAYAGTYKISRCAGGLHFVKLHKTLLTPTQKNWSFFWVRALENLPNICLFITEPMSEFCQLYLLLSKIFKAFPALFLPCFSCCFTTN